MTVVKPSLGLFARELPHVPQIWAGQWRKASTLDGLIEEGAERPPVIVIPGLMSHDGATSILRRTIEQSGLPTYPSNIGFMRGITKDRMAKAQGRLAQIAEKHSGRVVLVGWSLGGLYTRVLAQRHPDLVKMVVTLGTPFSGDRKANNAWRVYEFLNDHGVNAPPISDNPSVKPPVHTVAIWSGLDGVIAPECARGQPHERDTQVEIDARHLSMGAGRKAAEDITRILARELAKA